MLALRDAGRDVRAAAVVAILGLATLPAFDGEPVVRHLVAFEEPQAFRVEPRTLPSGLVVNVPSNETLCCWNAPLPCTPYPNPALRLRDPGNLEAGFRIDPTLATAGAATR